LAENSFKYYYPYDQRYRDISQTPWQKFNDDGVIVVKKLRLKDHYKIDSKILFPDNDKSDTFFHPIVIANCILGNYNLYVDHNDSLYLDVFWNNIKWLVNNGVSYNNCLLFPFPYGLKEFNSEPNWVSGMYQGQILSCFSRAYHLSGDPQYLDLCQRTWNSYELKLGEKYGFRYVDHYGLWFEEAPKLPANHILNGFIYAIWGILDYFKISGKQELNNTWNQCIETVLKAIEDYDLGYWSLYDLKGTITSYYYQSVHIIQMQALYDQTGFEIFKEKSEKWNYQLRSPSCRFRKKIYNVRQEISRGRLGLNIRNAIRGTR
jgi:hypothetical protein